MKNEMNDKIPYAKMLEDGIKKLTEGKAQNAVLCGLLEDGTTCVAYAMVKDALDEYEDEEGGESNG